MSETIHRWDIDIISQMKNEISIICKSLEENRNLLVSEGFEILGDWHGMAGNKAVFVTAANAETLTNLISGYKEMEEYLDCMITKHYVPCEENVKSRTVMLLQEADYGE